jgi:hypothetical protein
MLILSISFELNSDTLLSRDGWPTWLVNGVDYLQEISEEEEWVSLLVSFIELELQLGPNEIVGWQLL